MSPSTASSYFTAIPTIKRWGGWVLITVGTWFNLLSIFSNTLEDLFPV